MNKANDWTNEVLGNLNTSVGKQANLLYHDNEIEHSPNYIKAHNISIELKGRECDDEITCEMIDNKGRQILRTFFQITQHRKVRVVATTGKTLSYCRAFINLVMYEMVNIKVEL